MRNNKQEKVHIHRVVQNKLEKQGKTQGMKCPETYQKIYDAYKKIIDEKGMIPISALGDGRYS